MREVGFSFVKDKDGKPFKPYKRQHHLFDVNIGHDVEIGQSIIEKGSYRDTVIGDGCRIDHDVMIAHNAIIGKYCLICAGAVVGGSAVIGDECYLGLNCTIKPHVKIANNVTIGQAANVITDILEPFTTHAGNPSRKIADEQRPI